MLTTGRINTNLSTKNCCEFSDANEGGNEGLLVGALGIKYMYSRIRLSNSRLWLGSVRAGPAIPAAA
jgi:hypothetical protein